MARKRDSFERKISTFLIMLISGLVLSQGQFSSVGFASERLTSKQLTQIGHKQLEEGRAQKALKTWQRATKIYRTEGNSIGVMGSLINESLAQKALGLDYSACQTLVEALELEDWVCINSTKRSKEYIDKLSLMLREQKALRSGNLEKLKVKIIGLSNLGNALRQVGQPQRSQIVLLHGLSLSQKLSNSSFTSQILLSLANTERILYRQAKNKYLLTSEPVSREKAEFTAESKLKKAGTLYEKSLALSDGGNSDLTIRVRLNQLSLLLEFLDWSKINDSDLKGLKYQDLLQQYVKNLLSEDFEKLPAIESVYAQINFANSLIKISQNRELSKVLTSENIKPLSIALSKGIKAYRKAEKINNRRAMSFGLEIIGEIYNYQNRVIDSKQYLSKALSLAKSTQAEEIAYRLQQKLGRLYQKRGSIQAAERMYAGAINSLDQVRGNVISINPEFQFNFREKVEPVYREYLELLLSQPSPDFEKVIQIQEALKLAELENYLQCGKLTSIGRSPKDKNNSLNVEKSANDSYTIYLINFLKRIEIIVKTPEQKFHRHTVDKNLVNEDINTLIDFIQYNDFFDVESEYFLSNLQNVYNSIIKPIKKYLPAKGKLVFVPDNYFQSLPIGMLHDGKDYLMKSYNISVGLNLPLQGRISSKDKDIKVIFAGISEPINQLNALPEVEKEAALVKENTSKLKLLLNKKFTNSRFQRVISQKSNFPVIHISTHGQFSSDPEQTYILAWDEAINVREFESLIRNHKVPIELLVLSACQTAKGDKRSGLGIAGVAVMAGAQNTLATLWLVDAESTAILMGDFYKGLKNGLNEVEALRQAQIALSKNPKYSHPYYWAPFIVVSR